MRYTKTYGTAGSRVESLRATPSEDQRSVQPSIEAHASTCVLDTATRWRHQAVGSSSDGKYVDVDGVCRTLRCTYEGIVVKI